MSIGLAGYSCNSGLGELNRQVVKHIPEISRWIIRPHSKLGYQEPERDIDYQVHDKRFPHGFLDGLSTILFFETEFYPGLAKQARIEGKRVVCVPMLEWTPDKKRRKNSWLDEVDLFICPTKQCYDTLSEEGLPCVYFPWPCDTDRYRFVKVEYCHQFLFIEGNGGFLGRKGGDVVRKAKKIWPEMPLIVKTMKDRKEWPEGTNFVKPGEDNKTLYMHGDVLLYPAHCDGIGLQPYEAMTSGMPVITPDAEPWSEIPALYRIPAGVEPKTIGKRDVPWTSSSPEKLAEICKTLVGAKISTQSEIGKQWAEGRSWKYRIPEFTRLVTEGVSE